MIYAIIAAIFISIRDIFSKDLINRYEYIEYIIYANILIFIATIFYIYMNNVKLKMPSKNDLFIIILRLIIIYMIIEPCVFYSMKYCDNPGYAKSIINLNTLFVSILAILFLNVKMDRQKLLGVFLIITGSYYMS